MLSSIKDKLLNVRKSVPLFGPAADPPPARAPAAGCAALSHYRAHWAAMHALNEQNARLAQEAAAAAAAVSARVGADRASLARMSRLLPGLLPGVARCTRQMEALYAGAGAVEAALEALEALVADCEAEGAKREHLRHLRLYEARRAAALRAFEAELRGGRARREAEAEARRARELEERQQVFQEAFRSDLETFKHLGAIPKLELAKKQPSALLEEIEVDFDEKELDQFFED